MDPTCTNCGKTFIPRRNVASQRYCGQSVCQKARKKKWQQQKLKSDPDYRHNQSAAQVQWRRNHQDYWKQYRARNTDYTKRNRLLQQARNHRRRPKAPEIANRTIAKMDACESGKDLKNQLFGRYRLTPVEAGVIAKMDACIVEIRVISSLSGTANG